MPIPEYDEDSHPEVRRADDAYDARQEAERQNARIRDSVHALFMIAQHGTMQELRRAMAIAFAPPSRER
jgi:hypothetical protein